MAIPGCDVGEPLLRIDRLYFDAKDAPVELAVSYFDPEHLFNAD